MDDDGRSALAAADSTILPWTFSSATLYFEWQAWQVIFMCGEFRGAVYPCVRVCESLSTRRECASGR